MIIDRNVLVYTGACKDEMVRFLKLWPDGLELTVENLKLVREHEFPIWFPGINLSYQDLRKADLRKADLRGANLERANLEEADLEEANLRGANLCGAGLRGADLCGADLRGANLFGVDLRRANLEGANLEGAIFRITDLSKANLTKVILSEVQRSDCVGLDYPSAPKDPAQSKLWTGMKGACQNITKRLNT